MTEAIGYGAFAVVFGALVLMLIVAAFLLPREPR